MRVGDGIDELGGDADPVARPSYDDTNSNRQNLCVTPLGRVLINESWVGGAGADAGFSANTARKSAGSGTSACSH